MAKIPNTRTRTSHSLAIKVNGVIVGLIQKFGYTLNREVSAVYELNPDTTGEPVDNVPGNVKDLSLTVSRVDLFTSKMEEAFNGTDLSMLSDQNNPFEIYESWTNPDGSKEVYVYDGCWFTKITRNHDSTGNRVVTAEGSITYLTRKLIS